MSDTRWTPGPWKQGMSSGHNANLIYDKHDDSVAAVYGLPMHTSLDSLADNDRWQEGIANARLIAAAPELYAALDMILHRYVGLVNCGDCGNWNPEEEPQVMMARAALAKARGE